MRKITQLSKVDAKDYLTVDEAAESLRVKPNVIRNYLNLDKLKTYKFKTLTLLDRKEVEQWKTDK